MHKTNSVLRLCAALAATLALQGCLSPPITIRTSPAGAEVLADGQYIGTTPIEIFADDFFPSKGSGMEGWHRRGTLSFSRPGCRDKDVDVDNELMKRSFSIELDCEPAAATMYPANKTPVSRVTPQASPTPAPAPVPAAPMVLPREETTIDRLEELEVMRERRLISEEEYQSMRSRILREF